MHRLALKMTVELLNFFQKSDSSVKHRRHGYSLTSAFITSAWWHFIASPWLNLEHGCKKNRWKVFYLIWKLNINLSGAGHEFSRSYRGILDGLKEPTSNSWLLTLTRLSHFVVPPLLTPPRPGMNLEQDTKLQDEKEDFSLSNRLRNLTWGENPSTITVAGC